MSWSVHRRTWFIGYGSICGDSDSGEGEQTNNRQRSGPRNIGIAWIDSEGSVAAEWRRRFDLIDGKREFLFSLW